MAEMQYCAHCGVAITDTSTVREVDGHTFCCANCANAYTRMNAEEGA